MQRIVLKINDSHSLLESLLPSRLSRPEADDRHTPTYGHRNPNDSSDQRLPLNIQNINLRFHKLLITFSRESSH